MAVLNLLILLKSMPFLKTVIRTKREFSLVRTYYLSECDE